MHLGTYIECIKRHASCYQNNRKSFILRKRFIFKRLLTNICRKSMREEVEQNIILIQNTMYI